MSPQELLRSGKLGEAIQALSLEVRDHPADTRRRTFLFELLCMAGQYDRAEKHLNLLSQAGADAELGALLYRSAIVAERKRQAFFESGQYASAAPANAPSPGTLNGKPFRTIEDLDPRIGARLELFIAGEYVWLPFEHIGGITMQAPVMLRDTLWAIAQVRTGPSFKGQEFGEVLIPVLSPFSWKHERDEVKLGRATDWRQEGDNLVPSGQKLLLVDDEDAIPFLEIRELAFAETAPETSEAATASP
ncbi:MAG TPA: type VI secretion system accessory protein TagJ [Bryobacteraceae bacterium]|nr:type VI secretion system accessory protein TagJ [Bryobacteraceae bacterium]